MSTLSITWKAPTGFHTPFSLETGPDFRQLAISPSGVLIGCSSFFDTKVYRSVNGGLNWSEITPFPEYNGSLVIWSKILERFIMIAQIQVGVPGIEFLTSIDGISWTSIGSDSTEMFFPDGILFEDPVTSKIIHGTGFGFYSSTDFITWTDENVGGQTFGLYTYVPEVQMHFAFSFTGQLLKSVNGVNWSTAIDEIPFATVVWNPKTSKLMAYVPLLNETGDPVSSVFESSDGQSWAMASSIPNWLINVTYSPKFKSYFATSLNVLALGTTSSTKLLREYVSKSNLQPQNVSPTLLISSDGMEWTAYDNTSTNEPQILFNSFVIPEKNTWIGVGVGIQVAQISQGGTSGMVLLILLMVVLILVGLYFGFMGKKK